MGRLGAEGAALPRRNPLRLHHPRLSAHRRGAFRGRLRAAASFGRELRAGDPRHRRADPQPRRRRNLDGEAADAAVRGHRPVRHADAAGAAAAAEDHGGGRGRGALARSASSTCGRPPSRWCANGSSAISGPPGGSRTPRDGAGEVGRFLGGVPALLGARRDAGRTSSTPSTRDGLVLAPETVAAIGAGRGAAQPLDRVALWVIAALLAVVIWKMV